MSLVLYPYGNTDFSVYVVFRNKAQCTENGYSIFKRFNAVAGHNISALWVGLSAPMDSVAPLGKGAAITCKARLAMNPGKPTELGITIWI